MTALRTKIAELRVRLLALEVAAREGSQIPIERAEQAYFSALRAVRDRLLSLPNRIAPRLVSLAQEGPPETRIQSVRATLETEIRAILLEATEPPSLVEGPGPRRDRA